MPSHYENTEFRKIRKRVLAAIPNWQKWPRILRLLVANLPDVGADPLAIEDWCKERGYDYERLQKHLSNWHDAETVIHNFDRSGELPRLPKWRNPLAKAHLQALVSEGESFGQYLDLVAMKGAGQSGRMNLEQSNRMGFTEAGDPLSEQPEIRIFSGERVAGINIGPDEMEEVAEGEAASEDVQSLTDWDLSLADTSGQEQFLP